MCPTLFNIPLPGGHALPVPAYGVMLMTGFLLAVLLARRRAGALGLAQVDIFDMGIFAVIGGVLGARLFHVIIYRDNYFYQLPGQGLGETVLRSLGRMAATWNGGLVFYGGLIGGILALWLFARRRKIPLPDLLDFSAAPLGVGLAVTRIGCFLNGCCFGKPTDLPWGVSYPPGAHIGHTDPVHPTQLYETLAALAIAAGMWWGVYPRRKFSGQTACACAILYAVWRFGNEFLRADSGPWHPTVFGRTLNLGPLTVFQWMSLAFLAAFAAGYLVARRAGRAPFAPPAPAPEPEP